MKQTLVIGSTVVDVLLSVPRIPLRGEDTNIKSSVYRLGGCAYNVFMALRLFQIPRLLCSPVGTGIYGDMVREQLRAEGITPFINLEEENGCCYCLIDQEGERTFLSHHGAEYLFSRSWMEKVDFTKGDTVFISGIEIEDPTGGEIIDLVYEHPELKLHFAPGPRIAHIPPDRMAHILARRGNDGYGPILHLNEIEARWFSGEDTPEQAAERIIKRTANSLVITLGERGCYYRERDTEKGGLVPGFPTLVVDTVGAGDAHCGTVMACLKQGKNLKEACETANKISAAVVSNTGAVLHKIPF